MNDRLWRVVVTAFLWALITAAFSFVVILLAGRLTVIRAEIPMKPGKVSPVELTEYQKVMPVKCYKYEELVLQLQGLYQEQMKEGGDSGVNRSEFWKSGAGATWTWVLRMSDGLGCIVGAGVNWRK